MIMESGIHFRNQKKNRLCGGFFAFCAKLQSVKIALRSVKRTTDGNQYQQKYNIQHAINPEIRGLLHVNYLRSKWQKQ